MKLLVFHWLFLLAPLCWGSDFIRQIQILNGQSLIHDIPVSANSGQVMSQPIDADSSIFQLYATTIGANGGQSLVKLDEKTVGTFLPGGNVEIISIDPHFPPRSRADQPFTVRYTVSGLMANQSNQLPPFARQVRVARSFVLHSATDYTPTNEGGEYAGIQTFTQNGVFVENNRFQSLPFDRPTKAVGCETFMMYLDPSPGSSNRQELSSATVQIWPVAEVQFEELENNRIYNFIPSSARIHVSDLYPQSITYAQIYPGGYAPGTVGTPMPDTIVSYNSHVPQNVILSLSDMEQLVTDDGEYSVEVLTIAPFNGGAPEILGYRTFEIRSSIEVNAAIHSYDE